MEDRIVELEVRVSYQDKLIADLDEVVRAFATRVETLERELVQLREGAAREQLPIGPQDDKPPHY